ncbi:HVA22-like protein [Rhynchospora pubera]|uniref:HVA22-like protein n=1 Tax=Rhynchospora pubera TaxID=906938 RepID=A0AAV8D2S9_9POAL|nr:HVA22-like protein [Rhynchospora pubera]KAJ4761506.1 HVA22-like protein [Rhynchospora pubera]KAJ4813983.1 HVA22-like protein [Rhynchospora pubera]
MGSGSFLKVVAKNFDVLAGPVVSLVYPLYASVRAIETKSPVDDQQWLTYWVLYSFITLFELTFAGILDWLPFWPYAKLFFNCWLVLPQFNGAAYVYQNFVRPIFVNQQTINIWYVPRKKDNLNKSEDVLQAAERYIQENGTEAFERLINKTSQSRTSGSRSSVNNALKAPFSKLLESTGISNSGRGNNRRSILEEVEAERMAKADRGENPWGESYPIFDDDYRRHY